MSYIYIYIYTYIYIHIYIHIYIYIYIYTHTHTHYLEFNNCTIIIGKVYTKLYINIIIGIDLLELIASSALTALHKLPRHISEPSSELYAVHGYKSWKVDNFVLN